MDIIKDFVRPVLNRLWHGARQIAAITAETAADIYALSKHKPAE